MTVQYEDTIDDAYEFYTCWLKRTRTGKAYLQQIRLSRTALLVLLAIVQMWLFKFTVPFVGDAAIVLLAGIIGYLTGNIDFKRTVRRITAQQKKNRRSEPQLRTEGNFDFTRRIPICLVPQRTFGPMVSRTAFGRDD